MIRSSGNMIDLSSIIQKFQAMGIREFKREINVTTRMIYNRYRRLLRKYYRSGKLESGAFYTLFASGFSSVVGNTAMHAVFRELGTKPHIIRIKNKKVLAVPAEAYDGEYNDYGSRKLPFISKCGRWIILGKYTKNPGMKATGDLLESYIESVEVGDAFVKRLKERLSVTK